MLNDIRHALRTLRRSRGFAFIAIATLTVGIGTMTAVSSLVHRSLWRPLPYPRPDRLIRIWETQPGRARLGVSRLAVSYWRDHATTLESISEYSTYFQGDFLEIGATPLMVRMARVGPDFMRVLTARPSPPEPGYWLSDGLWRSAFGGAPVLGRPVRIERFSGFVQPVRGIMPVEFQTLTPVDVWLVSSERPRMELSERRFRNYSAVARMKAGVSRLDVESELQRLSLALAALYPDSHAGWVPETASLDEVLRGEMRQPMLALFVAAALVLLIACANVANMFTARGIETSRELSVRRALGAGRFRLAVHRVAEALIVAATGATLAAVVAYWIERAAAALVFPALPGDMGTATLPGRFVESGIEWGWFAAAAAAASLITVAAALCTRGVWRESAEELRGTSRMGSVRSAGGKLLIVFETALALILIVGAALVTASFVRLMRVEPGFDPANVTSIRLRQPIFKPGEVVRHYPTQRFARVAREAVDTVKQIPGVTSAAVLSFAPFTGDRMNARLALIEGPRAGSPDAQAARRLPDDAWIAGGDMQVVSPEFFAALGVAVRGRAFSRDDTLTDAQFDDFEAPRGPGAVIVSETLARRLWPGQDPLGKYLQVWNGAYNSSEVVGVVPDLRYGGLAHDAPPVLYVPYAQHPMAGATLLVRTSEPLALVLPRVRTGLAVLGSDLAIGKVQTMDALIATGVASRHVSAAVMTGFAIVGLALAAIGLGGTIASQVRRRTREIGLRIAVGAAPARVVRMFVLENLQLTGAGVLTGLVCAAMASRLLASLLFDISPRAAWIYAGASLAMLITAIAASYIPARRAARVDPMIALRAE